MDTTDLDEIASSLTPEQRAQIKGMLGIAKPAPAPRNPKPKFQYQYQSVKHRYSCKLCSHEYHRIYSVDILTEADLVPDGEVLIHVQTCHECVVRLSTMSAEDVAILAIRRIHILNRGGC